ncbi:MAG: cell wall hydrolase [Phenylobacterium sp.]
MLSRLGHWIRHHHHAAPIAGVQLGLVALLSATVAIAAVPGPITSAFQPQAAHEPRPGLVARAAAQIAAEPEPVVIRLQELSPDAARVWNAANPVAALPNPAAKPFTLNAEGVLDEARAVDCMTAAIYYEAAYESTEGQRAVAQVVLNRMRHPAFPKTVCGVVFQGSNRTTGCQFTFTCDGTLARKPVAEVWDRARVVAEAALHGYVMKKVGGATHYHADYVAPYWSPSLVKVGVVGAHIFYRWTGGWGLPPAFVGRYAGGEMAGLQIATLDGLSKTDARLTTGSAGEDAASVAPAQVEVADPDIKLASAAKDEPALVTAAASAKDAQEIIKAEDLDWAGRPKQKGPPRLAMPGSGPPH